MNVHQTIIKGIKEQLYFNNYLVLPNFGGFILKQTPSHFSASGGMLMPPSKTISFNAQLKQNDGILAQWVQVNLTCNNQQAIAHLNDFSEYCKSILLNKGRLTINGLGFFYADFENNICFEPQQQVNFLTSSFGLSPVSIREIVAEVSQHRETVFADRIITSTYPDQQENNFRPEIKKTRSYRKAAIIAFSGVLLLSCLLLVVSNAKLSGQLKASIFGKGEKLIYAPITYQELNLKNLDAGKKDYVADANGIAMLDLENNKTLAVQAIENTSADAGLIKAHPKNVKVSSGKKNFEIVLGCFGVLSNAKRMVKKLKSESILAELSGQNNKGLYIVSSGNFETKEEAIVKLSKFKNVCPNAWIKKGE
jgi:hypothetical protein